MTVTEEQVRKLRSRNAAERPDECGRLLRVGVLLAVGFWVVEAAIHAFIFYEGTFLQELMPRDTHEFWMRLVVCTILAAFGMYAQLTVNRIRQSDQERLALQKRLEGKLTDLLSDYVHICPNCKNIRSDEGHWEPIETYIHEQPGIDLTHSLCPECMTRLYPGT